MKERFSFAYQGFLFVPITTRPRMATKVVNLNRIYILCPGNRIAVDSSCSLFTSRDPDTYELPRALLAFGLITQERCDGLINEYTANSESRERRRNIRDLKEALAILDLTPDKEQAKLIEELDK